jgi:hypothetical protein
VRHLPNVVFVCTVFGAAGLLLFGMVPGAIAEVVLGLPWIVLSLPLLAFWMLLVVAVALRHLKLSTSKTQILLSQGAVGVVISTFLLLLFHVPERACFSMFVTEFQKLADDPPNDGERRWTLDRRIGPYFIDRYGLDRDGGVWFRTMAGVDGIGPDELSYGFAYRPAANGVPFGRSRRTLRHLFGDWYTFVGSSD